MTKQKPQWNKSNLFRRRRKKKHRKKDKCTNSTYIVSFLECSTLIFIEKRVVVPIAIPIALHSNACNMNCATFFCCLLVSLPIDHRDFLDPFDVCECMSIMDVITSIVFTCIHYPCGYSPSVQYNVKINPNMSSLNCVQSLCELRTGLRNCLELFLKPLVMRWLFVHRILPVDVEPTIYAVI